MIEVFFCTLFYEKIPVKKKGKIMKVVNGVYTSANIFTDNVETYALAQIQLLCDQQAFQDCKIRVMPDVHPIVVQLSRHKFNLFIMNRYM